MVESRQAQDASGFPITGVFRPSITHQIDATSSQSRVQAAAFDHRFEIPLLVAEKSDIRLMAKISSVGGGVSGAFELMLRSV